MHYLDKTKFLYLGFDESPIGGNSVGLIMACAFSNNQILTTKQRYITKAKDYLEHKKRGVEIVPPTLDSMQRRGLLGFSWMRSNQGRSFCRQRAAHATIGELILQMNFDPKKMVVLIDEFYPPQATKELLFEYLKIHNFEIPKEQIEVVGGGDRKVELINYADLIAYRIGAGFRRIQNRYNECDLPSIDISSDDLDYDFCRVDTLTPDRRETLDNLLSDKNVRKRMGM